MSCLGDKNVAVFLPYTQHPKRENKVTNTFTCKHRTQTHTRCILLLCPPPICACVRVCACVRACVCFCVGGCSARREIMKYRCLHNEAISSQLPVLESVQVLPKQYAIAMPWQLIYQETSSISRGPSDDKLLCLVPNHSVLAAGDSVSSHISRHISPEGNLQCLPAVTPG